MTETIIELTRNRDVLRAELNRTKNGDGSPFMEVGHSRGFSDLRFELINLVRSYLCDQIPWEPCDTVFQGLVYESVREGIFNDRGETEEESRSILAVDLGTQKMAAYAVVKKIQRTNANNVSAAATQPTVTASTSSPEFDP